jgi:hypothetical protein
VRGRHRDEALADEGRGREKEREQLLDHGIGASATPRQQLDPPPWRCRNSACVPHNDRLPGVLALLADPVPMQGLLQQLHAVGIQVDVASDLAAARTLFFGAGGHDCLLVAPDVRPGLARQVLQSLRTVDPEMALANFGPELGGEPAPARSATLRAYHPSSRAGTGALLRFLRAVKLR